MWQKPQTVKSTISSLGQLARIQFREFGLKIKHGIVDVAWYITTRMELFPDKRLYNKLDPIEIRVVLEKPIGSLKTSSHRRYKHYFYIRKRCFNLT